MELLERVETAVSLGSGGIHSTYDKNFGLELLAWRWKGEEGRNWEYWLKFVSGSFGGGLRGLGKRKT